MGGRYRTSKGSEIEKVNGKKKALFICENHFFSLAQLHMILAEALSEKYSVDIVVYENPNGIFKKSTLFNTIELPDSSRNGIDKNYVGIYEEILNNVEVNIPNVGNKPIFDYLLQQNYSFGIAEFNQMAGAFAAFRILGIEETFNVVASAFLPEYFQFIGIDVTKHIIPC
uniref:Uncharacterized protein n=1 Tax=Meloidogyne enterolobii TaxID=390850 RepID=A0A6V7VCR2_MELEN|nr:unnamed protein product [Meloidogyne enterolobii]